MKLYKIVGLLAMLGLSVPAMAQTLNSDSPPDPVSITVTDDKPGMSWFNLYTPGHQAMGGRVITSHNAFEFVSILVDQKTGHQYIVFMVPGQPPAITPRLDSDKIKDCEIAAGPVCLADSK